MTDVDHATTACCRNEQKSRVYEKNVRSKYMYTGNDCNFLDERARDASLSVEFVDYDARRDEYEKQRQKRSTRRDTVLFNKPSP